MLEFLVKFIGAELIFLLIMKIYGCIKNTLKRTENRILVPIMKLEKKSFENLFLALWKDAAEDFCESLTGEEYTGPFGMMHTKCTYYMKSNDIPGDLSFEITERNIITGEVLMKYTASLNIDAGSILLMTRCDSRYSKDVINNIVHDTVIASSGILECPDGKSLLDQLETLRKENEKFKIIKGGLSE